MNDLHRRYTDTLEHIHNFGSENAAKIAANAIAAANFALIAAFIVAIQATGAQGAAALNTKFNKTAMRKTAREHLYDLLLEISEAAATLALSDENFANKFRMPRTKRNDQTYLETARAFIIEATPLKQAFLDYAMDKDFLLNLQTAIDNLEQITNEQDEASRDSIDANAELSDKFNKALVARRVLLTIVPKLFRDEPGKLADWASASHVEKAAKKPETPTP